jgi:asparagine synthase (glutamine-hydrolysing)
LTQALAHLNRVDLRHLFERLGHRYQSRCDAKTLAHGREEGGEDPFGRLNGIFAFAIRDVRKRELIPAESA